MSTGDRAHYEISGGVFFNAVVQGEHVTIQLPPEINPALSGLPARLGGLVGRGDDLEALLAALDPEASEPRAVAVCAVAGLAGVGKTELAVQAAHAAVSNGWFPGGALFIDLNGYDEARRLDAGPALDSLLRALGIPAEYIPPHTQDRARLYASVLAELAKQGRRVLVVLDNAFSAEQARPLLPTDGATRAILTSRHTLGSLDAQLVELPVLSPEDAVDLLGRAVRTARGTEDSRVTEDPAQTHVVAGLCGFLPLALRIVAALLAEDPTRSVAAIALDLAQERTRLDELQYDDLAVRAAFELSYRHLSERQAQAFRLLPINPGPDVSTEAVAALTDGDNRTTRLTLTDLARAHLIERGTDSGRWRMHDLIRLYAVELGQQDAGTSHEAAVERILDYYLASATLASLPLSEPPVPVSDHFRDSAEALTWLDQERRNLVGCVALAGAEGLAKTAIDLTGHIYEYLARRRLFDDVIVVARTAVDAARSQGLRNEESVALNFLGNALRETRQFEPAVTAHLQAAAIGTAIGDRMRQGQALTNLGLALQELNRSTEAIDAHREAAAILAGIGERRGEGMALHNLGNALLAVDQFDEALTVLQTDLTICRELSDRRGEAVTLMSLGGALAKVHDEEAAVAVTRQAVEIFAELGDRYSTGVALLNLGTVLVERGRLDEAVARQEEAAVIFAEAGDRRNEGLARNNQGVTLGQAERFHEAVTAHRLARAAWQESGNREGEVNALTCEGTAQIGLGGVLAALGRFEDALAPLRQGIAICREVGKRDGESLALGTLGYALAMVGRFEEAVGALRTAAEIADRLGPLPWQAIVTARLGFALLHASRFDEAITTNRRAAELCGRVGDKHDQASALNDLGIALAQTRRFEEAVTANRQAARIFAELGEKGGQSVALTNVGNSLIQLGRTEEADAAFDELAALSARP